MACGWFGFCEHGDCHLLDYSYECGRRSGRLCGGHSRAQSPAARLIRGYGVGCRRRLDDWIAARFARCLLPWGCVSSAQLTGRPGRNRGWNGWRGRVSGTFSLPLPGRRARSARRSRLTIQGSAEEGWPFPAFRMRLDQVDASLIFGEDGTMWGKVGQCS